MPSTWSRRQNYERLYAEYATLCDVEIAARDATRVKQTELLAAIALMEANGEWNIGKGFS